MNWPGEGCKPVACVASTDLHGSGPVSVYVGKRILDGLGGGGGWIRCWAVLFEVFLGLDWGFMGCFKEFMICLVFLLVFVFMWV